jgi:hypothetical protein
MSLITVLRPDKSAVSSGDGPAGALAERRPIPDGAILTVIDNGKSHARIVLQMVADEVRERCPQIASVEVVSKTSAGILVSDEQARTVAARSALVITGLGDCGACSSCSTLDAIAFEKLGVPASVVITEPFTGLVDRFARIVGMPGYHNVVLPHPVATRSTAELRELVSGIADEIFEQLTVGASVREPALAGVL